MITDRLEIARPMYDRRARCVPTKCKGEQNGAVRLLCNVALLNSRVPIRKTDTIVGVVTVLMHVSNGILSEDNTTPRRDAYFVAASALKRSVVVSPGAAMKKPEENTTLPVMNFQSNTRE